MWWLAYHKSGDHVYLSPSTFAPEIKIDLNKNPNEAVVHLLHRIKNQGSDEMKPFQFDHRCGSFRVVIQRKRETVTQRCSIKKVFLEISENSQENIFVIVSFLIKKETLAQVFSCEFFEISKNTFSFRIPPVTASEKKRLEVYSEPSQLPMMESFCENR